MKKLTIKSFIKSSICFFLALLLASPVSAIPNESTLDYYDLNGIYYYDPTGNDSAFRDYCGLNGTASISGSNATEKIWTGLLSIGLTPEQAAGVMGNMAGESGFNPARHEEGQKTAYWGSIDILNDSVRAYGIGLIQWSKGRRVNLLHYIQSVDSNLMSYFMDPDQYSVNMSGDAFAEKAGSAIFDRLVQLELEFLKNELNTERTYKGIFNQTTVEDAATFFMHKVEVPGSYISYVLNHDQSAKDDYYSSLNLRRSRAQEYYNLYNGTTITPSDDSGNSSITNTNVTGADITIIGDSITDGSRNALSNKLSGIMIDAEVSRPFKYIMDNVNNIELRRVVIIALGTNNWSPTLKESDVQSVVDAIGPDKNIYFVNNFGATDNQEKNEAYTKNNDVFAAIQSRNSNVSVINWASSVSSGTSQYLAKDGIHPTPDGQKLFADLIYNAVTSNNLTSDGCMVSGDLQNLVVRYAWPEYHQPNYTEMMPDYAAAIQRRQSENKYVGGGSRPGIDCGGFVTTLLQDSGFAPEYNGYKSNVPPQEKWVKENGWTLLNGSETSQIDTGILQPGDVAFSGSPDHAGHTFVYVGQINGFDSNIASASYGGSSDTPAWRSPMAGKEDLTTGKGYPVRWYRKS